MIADLGYRATGMPLSGSKGPVSSAPLAVAVVTSRFHSSARKEANEERKPMQTPLPQFWSWYGTALDAERLTNVD